MTLGELLAGIGQRLAAAGIPYMVTGSVASSFHGEPRSTRDLDIVIDPAPEALDAFVRSLPVDAFYVDLEAAQGALAERGRFNVVEHASHDTLTGGPGSSSESSGPAGCRGS